MKTSKLAGLAVLLAAGFAQAQDVKLNAIVEVWYTQMLDNNLRLDKAEPNGYMSNPSLNAAFKENQFYVRRTEIYLGSKIGDTLSWNIMFDPNNSGNASTYGNILNDAFITWQPTKDFSLKVGQFKPLQTWEASMKGSAFVNFYDRSMHARYFGDKRDRGIVATYGFGDPKGFSGKFNLGFTNGNTDDGSAGKSNDSNAQKDVVSRLEMSYGTDHNFGVYYREGVTNLKDSTMVAGTGWSGAGYVTVPSNTQILDNKDKTTNLGAYYVYETSKWLGSVEMINGLLGRRYPSLYDTTTAAVKRQHLDQKFLGYTLTGIYKMGNHWITARYDYLNFNQGDDWYTATNPYTTTVATGAATGNDYSPKYTEAILGYNYIFNPAKATFAKFKVNYIHRSKNFLQPRVGQTGEQGGDSIVAGIMVGF